MQHFHNNLLNLFNAYREFIFFDQTEMYNMNIFDYLGKAEKELYETFTTDINFIAENSKRINGLNKIFREIQQNHLCSNSSTHELSNIAKCDYYLEVITSLGFYNFVSFWIEEIRIKKNYAVSVNNKEIIITNNENDEEGISMLHSNTIFLYNNGEIHPDVNFLFNYVILPYINEERKLSVDKIIETINSKKKIYIILLIAYFILIIILYIFFWRPIINSSKYLIYKTKNMLRIIPVEILVSQTNIKSLIGVSYLNE